MAALTKSTVRLYVQVSALIVSEPPTIRPEARAGTVAGRAFKGKVDCLAPDCNGLRAAFEWEMKCGADEAQPGKGDRNP